MIDESTQKMVDSLSLQECRELSTLVRKRVGALAADPPDSIRRELRKGRHVSVKIRGHVVTGSIEHMEGNCLVLRFLNGETAFVLAVDVLPDGFDRGLTPVPPSVLTDHAADDAVRRRIPLEKLPVIFGGQLYAVCGRWGLTVEARRLVPSFAPEYLPAAMLTELVPAEEGAGADTEKKESGKGELRLCL